MLLDIYRRVDVAMLRLTPSHSCWNEQPATADGCVHCAIQLRCGEQLVSIVIPLTFSHILFGGNNIIIKAFLPSQQTTIPSQNEKKTNELDAGV